MNIKKRVKKVVKRDYKYLDILRVFLCLFVLLYHLDIVKGGYLAVVVFFVISGYLSIISIYGKFSIKDYYKKRFIKLYIPLFVVTFISIGIISLFNDVIWINIKKETLSIIFGYNNWWQIGVNSDYFARASSSPFTHLWYISILMQFDIIFPFIYLILEKCKKKVNKLIPILSTFVLSVLSFLVFFIFYKQGNITSAYYNSFARVNAILLGMLLGYIHRDYKPMFINDFKNKYKKIIFSIYMLLLILMFIFISSDSKLFGISFLLSTLLSLRLLDYIYVIKDKNNKLLKYLASISYVVYLVQYPIIFLFDYSNLSNIVRILLIVLLVLISSILITYGLNNKEKALFRKIMFIIILFLTGFGIIRYFVSDDPTIELEKLKEQLAENEKLMEEQQKEYEIRMLQQQEEINKQLEELATQEENIGEYVKNLQITFVGDSVMLGAVNNLGNMFKNSYSDAKVSRSVWAGITVLREVKAKGILGKVVVINLGANGDCSGNCKDTLMQTIPEDREVFWLTVTNDAEVHFNDNIKKFAEKYPNLHIIDWEAASKGHSEYFYADGLHLPGTGRAAYTETIYNALCDFYKDKLKVEKEEMLKKHEEDKIKGLEFYGNELLINLYPFIESNYKEAKINSNKDYKYSTLIKELKVNLNDIKENVLFAFDESISIKKEDYLEIVNLLSNRKVYVISLNSDLTKELNSLNKDNLIVLDFSNIDNNYYALDRIHLSKEGNEELAKLVINNFKEEEIDEK